jgi:aminoglycoside phosphotransferase (APT) family kinase protein
VRNDEEPPVADAHLTAHGEQPEGIEAVGVTAWLRDRADVTPPLRFEMIQGGRSNLTYTVTDADGRHLILRRPPLHGVLESAHDMGREHRILSALAASTVPVPDCVGFEPDPEVTGAPFYVMRFVDGVVVRDAATATSALAAPVRADASDDVADVLAALHAVDVDEVGLGDLARREGYVQRQLRRWHGQLEQAATRELPVLRDVHHRLAASVPDQGQAAIVHGDYRLDNLILDPATGRVVAVLDWELTTLGDPRADVGLLSVYWSERGDPTIPLLDAPTMAPGFRSRAEVLARYTDTSGRDPGELAYFVAFGYWKIACILEGVHTRYAAGAYGEGDDSFRAFGDLVLELGERAADAAAEAGR